MCVDMCVWICVCGAVCVERVQQRAAECVKGERVSVSFYRQHAMYDKATADKTVCHYRRGWGGGSNTVMLLMLFCNSKETRRYYAIRRRQNAQVRFMFYSPLASVTPKWS